MLQTSKHDGSLHLSNVIYIQNHKKFFMMVSGDFGGELQVPPYNKKARGHTPVVTQPGVSFQHGKFSHASTYMCNQSGGSGHCHLPCGGEDSPRSSIWPMYCRGQKCSTEHNYSTTGDTAKGPSTKNICIHMVDTWVT